MIQSLWMIAPNVAAHRQLAQAEELMPRPLFFDGTTNVLWIKSIAPLSSAISSAQSRLRRPVIVKYLPDAYIKGKVEATAKLIDRLKVYNNEFETFQDIVKIVEEFNQEINNENLHWLLDDTPSLRLKKELEYLNPMPAFESLSSYFPQVKEYKVSKESMITYNGKNTQ